MTLPRALSALLAAGYLAAAGLEAGATAMALLALPLAVLLWFIWDAETAASLTGTFGWQRVTRPSPPGLVRGLAWAFLLVPLLGGVVRWLRAS